MVTLVESWFNRDCQKASSKLRQRHHPSCPTQTVLAAVVSLQAFKIVMLAWILYSLQALLAGLFLVFVGFPAAVAVWESLIRKTASKNGSVASHQAVSRLCVGQVWHTRLQPKIHAFSYPIFMFALDLEESFGTFLWPIVRFQALRDHLKNGEGRSSTPENNTSSKIPSLILADQILQLVSEKTKAKFEPSLETHRILLMTHLEYYGYNFNPVSFYYLVNKKTKKIDTIVGEVSNTPWTEMYCYVLHPDSVDKVQLESKNQGSTSMKTAERKDYRFPKEFHVSPFMEMHYWYDWTFQGTPGIDKDLFVVNSMRRRQEGEPDDLVFTAKLQVTSLPITAWNVVWQMIRFPIFCMIIQIWIHYEALWLFLKGIVYVPHPEGSETAASQIIASIMTPFFSLRDLFNPKSKTV